MTVWVLFFKDELENIFESEQAAWAYKDRVFPFSQDLYVEEWVVL